MINNCSDDEKQWYDDRRKVYRPIGEVHVLLIGESPPNPQSGRRHFFYLPQFLWPDYLYRAVAQAIYGIRVDYYAEEKDLEKNRILANLRDDGFWLIDAVECPIGSVLRIPGGLTKKEEKKLRKRLRQDLLADPNTISNLIQRCIHGNPSRGVITCHRGVFKQSEQALSDAKINVLADLPFPRYERDISTFVSGMKQALRDGGWNLQTSQWQ